MLKTAPPWSPSWNIRYCIPGIPASLSDQPPTPSQNFLPRSMSCAGNSTCTIFLPISKASCRRRSYQLTPPRAKGRAMVRGIVLYDDEPDAARYEQHAELCRKVPGATFRHGKVFGAPMGEPRYRYYAEWEWPDLDSFKSAARSEEFMATGKDAVEMGGSFRVMFANVD